MGIEEVIKTLNDLENYIDDEWDKEDPNIVAEAEKSIIALETAIQALKTGKTVGLVTINNKTYSVVETE